MLYVKYVEYGPTASEEMSFENVDRLTTDGQTTDTFIYYKLTYEPLAHVSSCELIIAYYNFSQKDNQCMLVHVYC